MTDSTTLLYVPMPDQMTAKEIASQLLSKKMVACANIFAPHLSVYEWNGKIESSDECVMILKTTVEQAAAAEEMLLELHPYDCPCVLTLNTDKTNSQFLDWVKKQTT